MSSLFMHRSPSRLFLLAALAPIVCSAQSDPAQEVSSPALRAAEAVIAARRIPNAFQDPQFDISPDGTSTVYLTAQPTTNGAAHELVLWTADVGRQTSARALAHFAESANPTPGINPRFSPDGRSVAYLEFASAGVKLMRVELPSGEPTSLINSESFSGVAGLSADATVESFAWSPDSRSIALIVAPGGEAESASGMETSVAWPYGSEGPTRRLVLLDLRTNKARALTGAELDVSSLSWSPDGRQLAIAASPASSADRFYDQDIYLVDCASATARPVVQLPGLDSEPQWSPDGRHIAFATQAGEGSKDWLQVLGVYDLAAAKVTFPALQEFQAGFGSPHNVRWRSRDSLLFVSMHHLRTPISEVSVSSGRLSNFSSDDVPFVAGIAVARQSSSVAFTRESLSEPGDLFVTSGTSFAPRQVTHLNPSLVLPPVNMRVIDWKSRDGKWDLQGLLLTAPDTTGRRPLITVIEGGPSMIRQEFGLGVQYPVHAFVAAGYAVFLPNTRGRSGYSHAFRRAIRDEKDYVGGGFQDVMSGIDHLIDIGAADGERLGVAGFSYGAYLTAYTVTQTTRFRAASINDAGFDLTVESATFAADQERLRMWKDMIGYSDPYDAADAALMRAQSPLLHVNTVRTPCLLESGVKAFGGMDDRVLPLFQGLRRFHVPSEFVRYPRTGHGLTEPRLRVESARRNLEWFDYWLLGKTTPRMLERYGEPAR